MDASAAVRDSSRRVPTVDLFEFVQGASNPRSAAAPCISVGGQALAFLRKRRQDGSWHMESKKKQPSGGKVQP